MHWTLKSAFAGVVMTLSATSAYAQVCKEPNGPAVGKANLDCDMSYRNQVVACDKVNPASTTEILGTRPACPAKPMPMLDTPRKSYISDYSAYLWHYPRDATENSRPYAGSYALGTPGDASRTFQLFGNTAPGTRRLASCTTQIKMPSDPTTVADWAKLTRLQADNCANQYILQDSIYPYQKENTQILSGDDPAHPEARLTLQTECQPLKTFQDTTNEYKASDYLEAAWKKLMQDASYRKATSVVNCVPCQLTGALSKLNLPCDHEPHLPCGVTLENPIAPPSPFPEVLLSSISTIKYEGIVDPTHPFSPRWDYLLNDRDYSNISASSIGSLSATAAAIQLALNIYQSPTKDAIFCAGVKKSQETDAKKKDNDEVKVDVLSFRRKMFEDSLTKRVGYNSICKLHVNPFTSGHDALFIVAPLSFCFKITGFSIFFPWVYAKGNDCWKCYGLNGKVDDESQHPPCTTTYVGKDLRISWGLPGGLNAFKRPANCGTKFDTICRKLRAPYTQLNRLKMRYHNPDDDEDKDGDNVVLKEGALEGMSFHEYFGNHMPYPKLWDIGQSLQRVPTSDKNNQPPTDTTGQFTTIIGVGHEAAAKVASDAVGADADGKTPEDKYKDLRCKGQGWGSMLSGLPLGADGLPLPVSFAGVNIFLPDPVTSWTEMKLYQARTLRNVGLSCIARYEKVFKPGSAENMMLLIAGGEWQKAIITKCDHAANGRTSNCKFMTIKEYTDAGNPADDNNTVYLKQLLPDMHPLAWRGYMAAKDTATRFPAFGGSPMISSSGLDNAKPGDILMLPNGPGNSIASPGLAKLAFVIETYLPNDHTDCDSKGGCYVRVLEPDDGKWPDVCGTTDTWGEMKSRYYFKPGQLPAAAQAEYDHISSTGDCEETKLSYCEQSGWNSLQIYRPANDVRQGCQNKDTAASCEKDE